MEFTIKLPADYVNIIFTALDELPHKASRRVVDHVLQQIRAQEAAAQNAPKTEADTAGLTD